MDHPLNPSRRDFLTTFAGTGCAMLLDSNRVLAAEADPRVAQIVSKTIAVDMHSHVQIRYGNDPADAKLDLDIDLADEVKRSGFSAICETYAVDNIVVSEVGGYYNLQLQGLAFEDRLLARNQMKRALNMKDLQTAHDQKQPIVIQSTEGAQFIEGRLERIEEAYRRGLRHLQLVHERDDLVSPLGDVYTAPAAHLGGLTPFGAQVIKECTRLGIVVDLAHGTSETVTGALQVATQPLIVSHTSLASADGSGMSADMRRRLISKDIARAVADAGGVIGAWFRMTTTIKEYVEAIKYMVDTLGVDHVGIGTDTDLTASFVLPYTNKIWPDQNDGFFYAVAGEMLRQGFTPNEVSKIGGGNFCRIFAKVTADHG
jgi:membrane dipeptidase